jgi:N-methylhydantoinase B
LVTEVVKEIEPYLIVVLYRKFEAITREMTNTLLRSARSCVISSAKDFSCGITDAQHRIICVAEGLPIHVASCGIAAKVMTELFDDIRPGDCFLNNSPYYGNTHHADFTTSVPVFYKGAHLFTTNARAHQADCGNSQPTTYMPFSKDVYEEGALDFPCVRVQRDYKDIKDIIRMCRSRIRVPDQWYGDYLAQVGAARIGEREIIKLCDKYGVDIIKAFAEQWQGYGKRRMMEAISKLPKGTWSAEAKHDPIPGVAENGITFKLKMTVDPEGGYITLDFTESDDCVPGGFNMDEATILAAGNIGVLNNLDPTIPHNDGAFSRIKLKLRKGCVAGIPIMPTCCSIATSPTVQRPINLVQSIFAQFGEDKGMAEGALAMPASCGVISGVDWRSGAPYVNQLNLGFMGGPGVYGHDGWITYNEPDCGGTIHFDSIEVDEQKYPIMIEEDELIADSGGPGRWRGAPGTSCIMRPRHNRGVWAYVSDGHLFPAKGVHGGQAGRASDVWKYDIHKKDRVDLAKISLELLTTDEAIVSESCGGGGFGDPLERDPEKVRWDVREGFVSVDKARDIYGVVLDTVPEKYAVDYKATEKLREELKKRKETKE